MINLPDKLHELWSEKTKRLVWRQVWVALAMAQHKAGIITDDQIKDLEAHIGDVDIQRSMEIERVTKHDLMSEIKVYTEQCVIGGGVIHLGATSADIEENTDALLIRKSLHIISDRMDRLSSFKYKDTLEEFRPVILSDVRSLDLCRSEIRGKGMKGAVGTSASYAQLLQGSGVSPQQMEAWVMIKLGLKPFVVSTQVATRKQEYRVGCVMANVGLTLFAIASALNDGRILSTKGRCEIQSREYMMSGLTGVLWSNASHSLLERTLDDSANRRYVLPNIFLDTDRNIETIISCLESESLI